MESPYFDMKNPFDDAKTIFIGGCPRSGTTMLGSMLGSAKGCVATPESQFKDAIPAKLTVDWVQGLKREDLLSVLNNNFRFKIWEIRFPAVELPDFLNPADYRRLLLSLVNAYAKTQDRKEWQFWIDHTPENIQVPLTLMRIFPEAKFIHLVRDPRAVCASLLSVDWGFYSAGKAALYWAQKISYGQAFERAFPDKCIRVYYEDIVAAPEKAMKDICGFCGIEFSSSVLSGGGFRLPDYTKKQHKLVGLKPDPCRLNAWKESLDAWQIAEIEELIGDLMELVGYKKFVSGRLSRRALTKRVYQSVMPLAAYLKSKRHHLKKRFYGSF